MPAGGTVCAMTTDERDTITLRGAPGLFAAVPVLLGFRPTDSLVLVCLRAPGASLSQLARADLGSGPSACARLVDFARRYADAAALVCYCPTGRRPALLDAVMGGLQMAGVPLAGAWLVDRERAWAVGLDGESFPAEDEDDPGVVHLRAAHALAGRAVLPTRDHLVDSIAAPTGARMRDAVAVRAEVAREPTPPGRRVASRALQECERTGSVRPRTAARLARAIDDPRVRDDLVVRALQEADRPWVAMLISVAACTPGRPAAQVCVVLSLLAYRNGEGALAQVAAQRALETDPGHTLARMMVEVMDKAMPPDRLADLLEHPGGGQPASARKGASTSATDNR